MPPSLFAMKPGLPRPLRPTRTLAALLLAGCTIIACYTLARDDRNDREPAAATPPQQSTRQPAEVTPKAGLPAPATQFAGSAAATDPAPTQAPSAESIAKLVKDATEGDADSRADAIFALASAPAAQAVPVLHGIIVSGDIGNGHLALDSLRTMALNQGDSDGAIRNSVRFAVYHGSSDTITQSAQEILDELEKSAGPASP